MATEMTREHVVATLGKALHHARKQENRPQQFAIEDVAMMLDEGDTLWHEVWDEVERIDREKGDTQADVERIHAIRAHLGLLPEVPRHEAR